MSDPLFTNETDKPGHFDFFSFNQELDFFSTFKIFTRHLKNLKRNIKITDYFQKMSIWPWFASSGCVIS